MEYINFSSPCFEDDQEVTSVKKNLMPTREQRKGRGRNMRLQDCFLQHQGITKNYLPKKLRQQMDFSESSSSSSSSSSDSSSSSSSSSSDSEEELKTVMKPRIPISQFLWRTKQQQMPREWFTVVDLEGFYPQDVTAKLNPQCRILVIKAKKDNIRQQQQMEQLEERGQTFGKNKLMRIIPLPENIRLEQLRVKVTTRGELVVKAPFLTRSEMQQKQHLRNISSTWIPLKVTIKGSDVFGTQHQHTKSLFRTKRCQQRGLDDLMLEKEEILGGEEQEWNKRNTTTTTTLRTEYIRDEVTGKPAMLVKINVVGFRPEEVRVRVVESKRVLIVEAINKRFSTIQQQQQEKQPQQGLTMKYLLREFVLPEFVDVSHIAFRVLNTGVLAIKLPLLKKNLKEETMLGGQRRRSEETVEEYPSSAQLMNRSNKWEKIHHCA